MNRIVYIAIGGIWAIMFAIVGFGIWSAPDIDVLSTLQKYKVVGQDYLDRKEIVPSSIKQSVPDDRFVLVYADYMKAFQDSENNYNAAYNLFNVAIEPRSLRGSQSSDLAYKRLDSLVKATALSYDMLAKAQQKIIADLKSLDTEGMKVYGEAIDGAIETVKVEEVGFRDEVTRTRLALEKYYKAILDFIAQKQGQYSVDGTAIFFSTVADQQYYDQLRRGRKEYERKLNDAFKDYRQDLREFNAKIPVDIK